MCAGRDDERCGAPNSVGFDSTLSRAWQQFERNLANHVGAMPRGTYITITYAQATPGQRGQRPYVDLVVVDDDRIVGIAALPSYLYPDAPVCTDTTMTQDLELHLMGWTKPGKPAADGAVMDYVLDRDRADSSLVAATTVATFREIWNVPHPSFLSAWVVGATDAESGPAHLNDASRVPVSMPSTVGMPSALRSLHTFCEVLATRLDPLTVESVCGTEELEELKVLARRHARACARYAAHVREVGPESACRVWEQQTRSWLNTVASLQAAQSRIVGQSHSTGPTRTSGPDRPAKSAGS